MTREEFEQAYAEHSKTTVAWLTAHGRVAAPCFCEADDCPGWQMVPIFVLEESRRTGSATATELATLAWLEEFWKTTIPARPSIKCPRCGCISYNPNDIREGYCGACHEFVRND